MSRISVVLLIVAALLLVCAGISDLQAQTTYSTTIGNGGVGIPDIQEVQIRFMVNLIWGDWQVMNDDGDGDYSFVRAEGDAYAWQVQITDPLIDPDWPEDNPYTPPVSVHWFDWEVAEL